VRIYSGRAPAITDRLNPPARPKPGPGQPISEVTLPTGAASLSPTKNVTLYLYGEYSKATAKLVAYRIRYWRAAGDGKNAADVMLQPAQDPPR
jgi:hypothetical protein